ncbi:hypothetical protein F4809DRAFT_645327 [Biscogniauxia mediterranea]|nr:hypothetical protein F4809DRAFT_645327 [Biscogniauxia mediterranea]
MNTEAADGDGTTSPPKRKRSSPEYEKLDDDNDNNNNDDDGENKGATGRTTRATTVSRRGVGNSCTYYTNLTTMTARTDTDTDPELPASQQFQFQRQRQRKDARRSGRRRRRPGPAGMSRRRPTCSGAATRRRRRSSGRRYFGPQAAAARIVGGGGAGVHTGRARSATRAGPFSQIWGPARAAAAAQQVHGRSTAWPSASCGSSTRAVDACFRDKYELDLLVEQVRLRRRRLRDRRPALAGAALSSC